MTKLPFRRLLLSAALLSSVALTGCDIDDSSEKPVASANPPITGSPVTVFSQGTHPLFSVPTGVLPLVTDIPFLSAASTLGESFDGTALAAYTVANPVVLAVNDLDGWSTNAAMDIVFSGSINPASVVANGTVFLVKLDTGEGDALDPASIVGVAPTLEQPTFAAQVISLNGGSNNVVRIMPTKPLDPAAKYLVFLTNGIVDGGAAATTPSTNFQALSTGAPGVLGSLDGIGQVLTASRGIAGNVISVGTGGTVTPTQGASMVTVAYTFTTTDPLAPLVAMAAPRAALVANGATVLEAGALAPATSLPQPRTLAIDPDASVNLGTLTGLSGSVGTLYTGHITLPYYLTAHDPDDATFSYLTQFWRANTTLATLLGITLPEDVTQTVSGGPTSPDGTYNVTYRYPFAAATGAQTVPLQVTLPQPNHNPPAPGGEKCEDLFTDGYPVAIYIHGITSDRTSVAALSHKLADRCIATVAIDLPVHGVPSSSPFAATLNMDRGTIAGAYYSGVTALRERHFEVVSGVTGLPQAMNFDTPNAAIDRSGAWFINLGNLQNTRDNMKQAVQDLLNLNASLGTISALDLDDNGQPDLDLDRVYVVGVSLGGIIGTTFTTVNQLAIVRDGSAGFAANLNPIKGLIVSAGGSQVTQILNNSNTFYPVINAGLTAAGVPAGTSNREAFLTVAQATVDSADPVNFAPVLGQLGVPTLVQMIVGGGDTTGLGDATSWQDDQVVPNGNPNYPLMGTAPLAALLGAGNAPDGTAVDGTDGNLLVQLAIGYHSSLLIPDTAPPPYSTGEELATGELQEEVASFIASDAMAIRIGQVGPGNVSSLYTLPNP